MDLRLTDEQRRSNDTVQDFMISDVGQDYTLAHMRLPKHELKQNLSTLPLTNNRVPGKLVLQRFCANPARVGTSHASGLGWSSKG